MMRWMLIFLVGHLVATAIVYGDEPFEPSETQTHMASLNDTYRASRGLSPHKLDAELCKLSQRWAEHMAARGWMGHGGGENIVAYGTSSVPATMAMWRASGPHNGFLLSGTTRAGWGHAISASGVHFWAGAFRGASGSGQTSTYQPSGSRWRLFGRRR